MFVTFGALMAGLAIPTLTFVKATESGVLDWIPVKNNIIITVSYLILFVVVILLTDLFVLENIEYTGEPVDGETLPQHFGYTVLHFFLAGAMFSISTVFIMSFLHVIYDSGKYAFQKWTP